MKSIRLYESIVLIRRRRITRFKRGFIALFFILSGSINAETSKEINIYYSADRTVGKSSGLSIEQGIRTALSQVSYKAKGYDLKLINLDHRGSTPRAKRHLQKYLSDDRALVMFSGMHSPPLLATREFINTSGILVLNPWAAAGPITRFPSKENWIFRLSVDDSKAGYVITKYAVERHGIKRPALLLEETGWGKSNLKTMTSALKARGLQAGAVKHFNWGLQDVSARIILREINQAKADGIFLVANASEGKAFVRAMASLPVEQRLPIFSHWGITGGDFSEEITVDIRDQISLYFIQTRFSFLDSLNSFQQGVLEQAKRTFPDDVNDAYDIKAPTGFIHAYDLTRILLAAIEENGLTGDIIQDRKAIRERLENMETEVEGLVKVYKKPFEQFSEENNDAHEALGIDDIVMARYGKKNEILLDN